MIASRHSVDEIREVLGCDTLGYLSLEGLRRTAEQLKHGICDACFSDEYPISAAGRHDVPQLSLFRPVAELDEDGEAPLG